MTPSDLERRIRQNIKDDLEGNYKYTMVDDIIPAIHVVLDLLWKKRRVAFYESEVLATKPTYPETEDDTIPVSDDWKDPIIQRVSAELLNTNATDASSRLAARTFTEQFLMAIQ